MKNSVPYTVMKQSDINHTSKNLTTELYAMKKDFPFLQTATINYIRKCFTIAIHQNKDHPENLKKAILNIVPHFYNEHQDCGEWCKHKDNPIKPYNRLPGKKPFSNVNLRKRLETAFTRHAANAHSLAPCSSSNVNESFNNMVACKAPKSKHYSKSGSYQARVNSAVCQKNIGPGYIHQINAKLGLSPGKVQAKSAKKLDKRKKMRYAVQGTKEYKRRRNMLKCQDFVATTTHELREGITYATGIGLVDITEEDTEEIPPPVSPPETELIADISQLLQITFDLETTSLYDNCEIVQVAATHDGKHFNQYILPERQIQPSASAITGITKLNGKLFLQGTIVDSVDAKEGLNRFSSWLVNFNSSIMLVGHNAKRFDAKHLCRYIKDKGMQDQFSCVTGFADTLPCIRKHFPQHPGGYSQKNLVMTLLPNTFKYNAHDALEDVIALATLKSECKLTQHLQKFSFTQSWVATNNQFQLD